MEINLRIECKVKAPQKLLKKWIIKSSTSRYTPPLINILTPLYDGEIKIK